MKVESRESLVAREANGGLPIDHRRLAAFMSAIAAVPATVLNLAGPLLKNLLPPFPRAARSTR
jgi:hypothetical protein